MKLRYFQKGFNYSQDGPGNRLIYHLQGCNMHCPWCANPEGLFLEEEALIQDIEEIYEEILSCRAVFIDGGGVTFTGGEATLQMSALKELLAMLHIQGIHTAIETNATHKKLVEIVPYLDYLIADIKHYNADKLRAETGGELDNILENLRAVMKFPLPVLLRVPLIHYFNGRREDAEGFAHLFSELKKEGNSFSVEFLSYHEYGRDKWKKCDKEYQVSDGFMTAEAVQKFEDAVRKEGIPVIRT